MSCTCQHQADQIHEGCDGMYDQEGGKGVSSGSGEVEAGIIIVAAECAIWVC